MAWAFCALAARGIEAGLEVQLSLLIIPFQIRGVETDEEITFLYRLPDNGVALFDGCCDGRIVCLCVLALNGPGGVVDFFHASSGDFRDLEGSPAGGII